jgi:GNAT superfamily N-acetyltransferase
MDFAVTRATEADAAEIGIIGPAAYAAHYFEDWTNDPAAFARQLATFGPDAVRETMKRPDARIWVARVDGPQGGVVIGFLTMIVGALDPIEARPNGAELPRIYLLSGATGGGVGRKLLAAAEAQAKAEGCTYVWLDVMEHADWARAAYERWGFTDIGEQTFHRKLTGGRGNMRVLRKELAQAPAVG